VVWAPPTFRHRHLHTGTGTYIQAPTYRHRHLHTGIYIQAPTYRHLHTGTYIQAPTYRHLHTGTGSDKEQKLSVRRCCTGSPLVWVGVWEPPCADGWPLLEWLPPCKGCFKVATCITSTYTHIHTQRHTHTHTHIHRILRAWIWGCHCLFCLQPFDV